MIYTKGLLRVRKLSQKLVTNVRSNKAAETLSKPANNLLRTDSRHVQTRSQMSTQQSLTPARVNLRSSSKICLAVRNFVALLQSCTSRFECLTENYLGVEFGQQPESLQRQRHLHGRRRQPSVLQADVQAQQPAGAQTQKATPQEQQLGFDSESVWKRAERRLETISIEVRCTAVAINQPISQYLRF